MEKENQLKEEEGKKDPLKKNSLKKTVPKKSDPELRNTRKGAMQGLHKKLGDFSRYYSLMISVALTSMFILFKDGSFSWHSFYVKLLFSFSAGLILLALFLNALATHTDRKSIYFHYFFLVGSDEKEREANFKAFHETKNIREKLENVGFYMTLVGFSLYVLMFFMVNVWGLDRIPENILNPSPVFNPTTLALRNVSVDKVIVKEDLKKEEIKKEDVKNEVMAVKEEKIQEKAIASNPKPVVKKVPPKALKKKKPVNKKSKQVAVPKPESTNASQTKMKETDEKKVVPLVPVVSPVPSDVPNRKKLPDKDISFVR